MIEGHFWATHGSATQAGVLSLVRRDEPALRTIASRADDRRDVLDEAHFTAAEPEEPAIDWPYAAGVLESAGRAEGGPAIVLAARNRRAFLASAPEAERNGARILAGALSLDTLELCEEKDRFSATLAAAGIPAVPGTRVETQAGLAAAIAAVEESGHQACVKPVRGVFGIGFWRLARTFPRFSVFADPDSRKANSEHFAEAYDGTKPLLVMPFLDGEETSVDMICDRGRTLFAVARRKHATFQTVRTDGPAVDVAREVASLLSLDGVVNVQTRVGTGFSGEHVLEANTRYSGGICFSDAAGVNVPALAARLFLGRGGRPVPPSLREEVVIRVDNAARAARAPVPAAA